MRSSLHTAVLLCVLGCRARSPEVPPADTPSEPQLQEQTDPPPEQHEDGGEENTETGDSAAPVEPAEGDGLTAVCERYVRCGGVYYPDVVSCIDATLDYWGRCEAMRDALNDHGNCIAALSCESFDADNDSPADTVCASHWQRLFEIDCG